MTKIEKDGTYSTRKAYDWTVTTSIYVDRWYDLLWFQKKIYYNDQ